MFSICRYQARGTNNKSSNSRTVTFWASDDNCLWLLKFNFDRSNKLVFLANICRQACRKMLFTSQLSWYSVWTMVTHTLCLPLIFLTHSFSPSAFCFFLFFFYLAIEVVAFYRLAGIIEFVLRKRTLDPKTKQTIQRWWKKHWTQEQKFQHFILKLKTYRRVFQRQITIEMKVMCTTPRLS